jgi:integrase/recombinase XerD
MHDPRYDGVSLFAPYANRKYLNAAERHRFVEASRRAPERVRLFCLMLRWSGARISEVLALTPAAIDIESGVVAIETLKRRRRGVVRQVPLPPSVIDDLDRVFGLREAQRDPHLAQSRIWCFSRTTAWRYVKAVMREAGVNGAPAMPKGLRHGFCVHAIQSNVPLHLVRCWLGHASLKTTGIYADLVGPEQLAFATRMWSETQPVQAIAAIRRLVSLVWRGAGAFGSRMRRKRMRQGE